MKLPGTSTTTTTSNTTTTTTTTTTNTNSNANNNTTTTSGRITTQSSIVSRKDGSNAELPTLTATQLDQFLAIYSELDHPDALQGFLVLRQILGYESTYACRIMECEQKEDWLGALNEYGLAHSLAAQSLDYHQQLKQFQKNQTKLLLLNNPPPPPPHHHHHHHNNMNINKRLKYTINPPKRSKNSFSSESPLSVPRNLLTVEDIIRVERGRLRCLIELGHLDTVIHESTAITASTRSTAAAVVTKETSSIRCYDDDDDDDVLLQTLSTELLPYGVEACWRLMNWGKLSSLNDMSVTTTANTTESSTSHSNTTTNPTATSANSNDQCLINGNLSTTTAIPPEGRFQLHVGKLFTQLERGDTTEFYQELTRTRNEIIGSLGAACKESYGRAYPYIARLQILSEIEDGMELIKASDMSEFNNPSNEMLTFSTYLEKFQWNQRLNVMSTSYNTFTTTLAIRRSILHIAGRSRNNGKARLLLDPSDRHYRSAKGSCSNRNNSNNNNSTNRNSNSCSNHSINTSPLIAENWLFLSRSMRKMGRYESARYALRQAELTGLTASTASTGDGLNILTHSSSSSSIHSNTTANTTASTTASANESARETILLEECHILRGMNQVNKALLLLEPVDLFGTLDLANQVKTYDTIMTHPKLNPLQRQQNILMNINPVVLGLLQNECKRVQLADRIHLATQLMVETKQKHGSVITDRYNTIQFLLKEYPYINMTNTNNDRNDNNNNTNNSNTNSNSNSINTTNTSSNTTSNHHVSINPIINAELLVNKTERVNYELGRYHESLYHDIIEKRTAEVELQQLLLSASSSGNRNNILGTSKNRNTSNNSSNNNNENQTAVAAVSVVMTVYTDELVTHHLHASIHYYMRCLKGNNSSLIRQALPRMLTLWFSFTSLKDDSSNGSNSSNETSTYTGIRTKASISSSSNNNSNNSNNNVNNQQLHLQRQLLLDSQKRINDVVRKFGVGLNTINRRVHAYAWYHCMPQLVSRLGHNNKETVATLHTILLETILTYPRQSIWHIACLLKSDNKLLVNIGRKFIIESSDILLKQSRHVEAKMLQDSMILFDKLSILAKLVVPDKEKRIKYEWLKNVTNGNNNNTNSSTSRMSGSSGSSGGSGNQQQLELDLTQFLVPNQHTLLNVPLCADNSSTITNSTNTRSHGSHSINIESSSSSLLSSSSSLYIKSFYDIVEVASSKARPKIIQLLTTSGKAVKFLLKQEKNGDLRKDARMMEFNAAINRMLSEDSEGRKRNLRLRTYGVVCLSEETGLLEWVNHTTALRQLILQSHYIYRDMNYHMNAIQNQKYSITTTTTTTTTGSTTMAAVPVIPPPIPECYPLLYPKDIMLPFQEMQIRYENNINGLVTEYRNMILDKCKPCLHKWFLETFQDPTEWLEARHRFIRSAAVWSVVGYVIGLGDRHTENILLDVNNGECVHVDFDCLFDKGLTLQRPEIVPFRLTPNMVDAMGVTGVEGDFRCTMEVCMHLLRINKDTLLSILEPFLYDPTVAWTRSGRAQQGAAVNITETSATSASKHTSATTSIITGAGAGGGGSTHNNSNNLEAKQALNKIAARLNGVYNIIHPHGERIRREALKNNNNNNNNNKAINNKNTSTSTSNNNNNNNNNNNSRGLGANKDEEMSLSVPGQIHRLIDEAMMEENLAQMFFGWQPWL